jgi:OmcA/MtrC family decaheme c-type cytochrome
MTFVARALIALAAAGTMSFPADPPPQAQTADSSSARGRAVRTATPAPATPVFTVDNVEFYLTDDGIAYIRPGLKLKVNSVTIGADRKPVVDISFTDNFDQPLDRAGKQTPGAISISFVLAQYDPETRVYTSHTVRTQTVPAGFPNAGKSAVQASADSGGTWTDLERGRARYTFRTALPAGYDQTATQSLAIYSARNLTDILGKSYYANLVHDFRGDNAPVAAMAKWDKIRDAACMNCHNTGLALHGGSRRDVKVCVTCHSPQTDDPDTGNSVDMAVMTHKIHHAHGLTNPYIIVGHNQVTHNYSHVTYPQDVRNCHNCHGGTTAANTPAQNDVWMTKPSRRACGACHDDINWVTGAGHAAGPQLNDATCASCHIPDSGEEFDASIVGAHTIPLKSKQLAGIKAEIVNVTNVAPGQKPTITIRVSDKNGAVDGTKLNTFSPMHAGPTSSYTTYFRETGTGTRSTFNPATGLTTYTFTNPIPENATGTWAFSADVYRSVSIKRANGGADISVRESAKNPQHYASLTGGAATPRRTSVSMDLCNRCHDSLALHGGQRMTIEECVMCHNPLKGDANQRPAEQGDEESVSMQRMIHRIHKGHLLTQEYTAYGNGRTRHNYNEVGYPGDLRNCTACHVNNSHQLPGKGDAVITKRDYFSPQAAGTAACLGCHDNRDAAAHAFLNTTTFHGQPAEACATCHGPGKTWSVDKSHAR